MVVTVLISQHRWDTDTEICLLKSKSTEHSSVDELAEVHLIQLLQLPTPNESPILELGDLRLHCERREHEVWDGRRLCLPRNEPGGRRDRSHGVAHHGGGLSVASLWSIAMHENRGVVTKLVTTTSSA